MKVELLAPGGSFEGVKSVINAGADAVYTGGLMFGAREYADNLNTEQMIEAIHYAHIHGKKIYLTVNTLLKDAEINEMLYDYILPFYENGLDAVIVQDFGVMNFIHTNFSGLPIHASTQMTIMGEDTTEFLKKYGVTRIVTPREFSINEIKNIYDKTNMEIESFVHGALCYCYSGQCFLSSYIGGRSGNRGKCAQPCRLNYDVIKKNQILNPGDSKYVLSPKDICTLNILPDIIEAGVYSLKIEGRMKKTEYAAGMTALYRKYIDLYLSKGRKGYRVEESDRKLAMDLFHRNGFSESYFYKQNGKDMISLKKPTFRTENAELMKRIREKYIEKESKEKINIYVTILKEQCIHIVAMMDEICVEIKGNVPQIANKTPISKENVEKQMSKLGNTPFIVDVMDVTMDEGLFVTMGELNTLRRRMTDELEKAILGAEDLDRKAGLCKTRKSVKIFTNTEEEILKSNRETVKMKMTALVTKKSQAMVLFNTKRINAIYLEADAFSNKEIAEIIEISEREETKIFLALPRVFRKKDKEKFDREYGRYLTSFEGYLVRNIEEYFYLTNKNFTENIVFDYNVYTWNDQSKEFFESINPKIKTTVPVELNYRELMQRGCRGEEMVVYGYMPVMITANCIAKTCDKCNKSDNCYLLRDRMSQNMTVRCVCSYCYNVIYNAKPLSLAKYGEEIRKLQVDSIRLEFLKETEKEIEKIIELYDKSFMDLNHPILDFTDSTRGHFKRGVK